MMVKIGSKTGRLEPFASELVDYLSDHMAIRFFSLLLLDHQSSLCSVSTVLKLISVSDGGLMT